MTEIIITTGANMPTSDDVALYQAYLAGPLGRTASLLPYRTPIEFLSASETQWAEDSMLVLPYPEDRALSSASRLKLQSLVQKAIQTKLPAIWVLTQARYVWLAIIAEAMRHGVCPDFRVTHSDFVTWSVWRDDISAYDFSRVQDADVTADMLSIYEIVTGNNGGNK